jgi:hypothetical protein
MIRMINHCNGAHSALDRNNPPEERRCAVKGSGTG